MLIHSQMGQEGSDFGFLHHTGMFLVMEKNVTLNPLTNLSGTVVIQGRVVYEAKDVNLNSRRLARRVKYRDVFHNIGFFGADTVVMYPNRVADLIDQFRWVHNRLPALFVFSVRRPYLGLSHCFKYTLLFYTPEKPGCKPAFRGSTYSYAAGRNGHG